MATPVKERRPEAAPARRCGRCASARATSSCERRPDGTIHLKSPHALAPYPAKLTERLEYWAATAPERIFLAQRDASRRLAQAHLCRDPGAGPPHRRGAAATRAFARAADRDPVRQRHRACADRPRRHVCRRPLRADLAGLFAHLAGFRQAALDHRAAHAGSRLHRRRRAPTAARSRRSCRPTSRSSSPATRLPAARPLRCRRC